VSQSPVDGTRSSSYETAWTAITELIHADGSWSSHERNVCYLNNGDGTFSDVSGTSGLDFDEDGRAFAALDIDGDGDLDLALKSRNEPALRLLRNDLGNGRNSLAVRLQGKDSNRDAAGARVTVTAGGDRITKTVRLGSGFLSQHGKELVFGLDKAEGAEEVRIEWPSGAVQEFTDVAAGQRILVREGEGGFEASAFTEPSTEAAAAEEPVPDSPRLESSSTWLVAPLEAPDFAAPDLEGGTRRLSDARGKPVVLNFWATWCPPCREELREFEAHRARFEEAGVELLAVSVDEPGEEQRVREYVRREGLTFPVLQADRRLAGVYNLVKKRLLNRRTDLRIPTTLLIGPEGRIHKLYEGPVAAEQILRDLPALADTAVERLRRALPFPEGRFYRSRPARNYTELGAALFEKDFVTAAAVYLEEAAAAAPSDPVAVYNLGAASVRQGRLSEAQRHLRRAVELAPDYPEAHNSLGAALARQDRLTEAIEHFRTALDLRPGYGRAARNLATAYEQSGRAAEAAAVLEKALAADAADVATLNQLGRLYGASGRLDDAQRMFDRAARIAPEDPRPRLNQALLLAQRGEADEAAAALESLIEQRPAFTPAYLALATVQARAGRAGRAKEALEQLLAIEPGHSQAKAMLKRVGP